MVITENIFDESGYSPYWSNPTRVYKISKSTPTPEDQKEPGMNYSTAVILINPAIRVVQGKYEDNGNSETFKTLDKNLKIDDYAVVESGTRWGITTVKIVAVDTSVDFDSPKEVKWAIQKIDMSAHLAIKEMENKAIEVIKAGEMRKRREDIKRNTLDAVANGEIDKLDIMKLSSNILPGSNQQSS